MKSKIKILLGLIFATLFFGSLNIGKVLAVEGTVPLDGACKPSHSNFDKPEEVCVTGLFCDSSTFNPVCASKLSNGKSCNRDEMCTSGYCDGDTTKCADYDPGVAKTVVPKEGNPTSTPAGSASTSSSSSSGSGGISKYKLNVPIGNLKVLDSPKTGQQCEITVFNKDKNENEKKMVPCTTVPWMAQYINVIYSWGIRFAALFAVLIMIIGGVMYVSAGSTGNQQTVTKAKTMIASALFGMVVLVGTYTILSLVNPDLLKLNSLGLQTIATLEFDANSPLFCEDWDFTKYKMDYPYNPLSSHCGDGQKYTLSPVEGNNATVVNNTCYSRICKGQNMACIPDESNKFFCDSSFISGNMIFAKDFAIPIIESEQSAKGYLEFVRLYEMEINGVDNQIGQQATINPESRVYNIRRQGDLELNTENYYLHIEVNDKSFGLTNDDQYYIDKSGNAIGVTDSLCCTYTCAGEGKINIALGCNLITKNDIQNTITKIDINTNKLFCGKIPLQESKDSYGHDYEYNNCYDIAKGKLPIGGLCSQDTDCKSNDCEKIGNEKKCECNDNGDCGTGEMCRTANGTFNICVSSNKKLVGAACTGDADCITDDCNNGFCECNSNGDCPNKQVCEKHGSPVPNSCKAGVDIGGACTSNDECNSTNCSSGKCICSNDKECAAGQYCYNKICANKKPVMASCADNNECASDDCEKEGGIKKCECNVDADCNVAGGQKCVTFVNDWNQCKP